MVISAPLMMLFVEWMKNRTVPPSSTCRTYHHITRRFRHTWQLVDNSYFCISIQTSVQSNLAKATLWSCHPLRQWIRLLVAGEQCDMLSCTGTLKWASMSPKKCPFHGGPGSHLIHDSLNPWISRQWHLNQFSWFCTHRQTDHTTCKICSQRGMLVLGSTDKGK